MVTITFIHVVIYSCRNVDVPDFKWYKCRVKISLWSACKQTRSHASILCALHFSLSLFNVHLYLRLTFITRYECFVLSTETLKHFERAMAAMAVNPSHSNSYTFCVRSAARIPISFATLLWKSIHIPLIHLLVTESTFTTSATFMHF